MAEIKLTAKLGRARAKRAHYFKLARPQVSNRTLRSAGERFGLRRDSSVASFSTDRDRLVFTDAASELVLYRASGGLQFRNLARWQVDDGGPDFELPDARAQRLARAALGRLDMDVGEIHFLKTARLRVGEADADMKKVTERTIDVAVAFQRMVDDLPVDGPGGKTVVYLDRDGQATGLEHLSREIAGVGGEGNLVPPEAAIDDLARHLRTKNGIVEVSQVRLGYFEEGWNRSQTILQPAYVLIGFAFAAESRVRRKIVHVAPALEHPPIRLTPPLRRKSPQPQRESRPRR